jgi:hypothetical protein
MGRCSTLDWYLPSVFADPQKSLFPQVLIEPFEEQLHLPALLAEPDDGQLGQCYIVGQNISIFPISESLKRMRCKYSGYS